MVTLQNHFEGLLEVQKASAMPCTLASSSNLLTNDAMSAATSVRFARQSSGRLSDEWEATMRQTHFHIEPFLFLFSIDRRAISAFKQLQWSPSFPLPLPGGLASCVVASSEQRFVSSSLLSIQFKKRKKLRYHESIGHIN